MNFNAKQFASKELPLLTGMQPGRITGLIQRRRFKPQFKQRPGVNTSKSYTGKDILRLVLLAPVMEYGLRYAGDPTVMKLLLKDLDELMEGKSVKSPRIIFARTSYSPWMYLTADLPAMVDLHTKRLERYLSLRMTMPWKEAVTASLQYATAKARGV